MNINIVPQSRSLASFTNYVERLIAGNPLPWIVAPYESQTGIFCGKALMVICHDPASARATANWINAEFASN